MKRKLSLLAAAMFVVSALALAQGAPTLREVLTAGGVKDLSLYPESFLNTTVRNEGNDRFLRLRSHLNPSASMTLVLSRDLKLLAQLEGWEVASLPNGAIVYQKNQVHFAPTHSLIISAFDPTTRREREIYPPRPYQAARKDFIARVSRAYKERGEDWFRIHNHHMNPEMFDSSLVGDVVVNAASKSITFDVRFGDRQNANDPLPFTESVHVTCAPIDRVERMQCKETLDRRLRTQLDSLIDSERSFAQLSVVSGSRDAFLANLNDQSILFRPNAVPGRAWALKSAPSPAQLSWAPEFADIAKSADLGYTTGPWQLRRTPQEPPGAFGHYVTVWKKQADGAWKIAIDHGISHPAGPQPAEVQSPSISSEIERPRPAGELARAKETLLQLERQMAGSGEIYSRLLSSDVRFYRDGGAPTIGARSPMPQTFRPIDGDVSGSAELGYVYGSVGTANYLHIWKKQPNGDWKIVLDLID